MSSLEQLYGKLVNELSQSSYDSSTVERFLVDIKEKIKHISTSASFNVYRPSLIEKLSSLLAYGEHSKNCLLQILFDTNHFFTYAKVEQKNVAAEVTKLFSRLLDPLDFEHLPKIYSKVVDKMKHFVEDLLNDHPGRKHRTETFFVILLSALKPLLAAKNSLVVMSGLSPPLFELLFDHLPLHNRLFISRYPTTHYALLKVAKYFTEINSFFATGSNLRKCLPKFSPSENLFTVPEARHSNCLAEIFSTLSILLHNGTVLNYDTIEAVLQWALAISTSMADVFLTILDSPQLLTFRTELFFFTFVGIKKSLATRKLLETVAQKYAIGGIIPHARNPTAALFWRKLLFLISTVTEIEFRRIFYVLRSTVLVKPLLDNSLADMLEKRQILLKEHSFGHREFLILTNFMLNLEPPLTLNANESCLRSVDSILKNVDRSNTIPESFDAWRYAVSQLAFYCVENRMKTSYGKPLETFTAFDNAIRLLMKASNTQEVPDNLEYLMFRDRVQVNDEEENYARIKLIPSEDFLRVNCFLSFIDVLEKFMVFAERGSILEIGKVSEPSRQFFSTNAGSCQGWITRISLPLLQVCYKAGRYAQVVRFATIICHNQKLKAEELGNSLKLDDSSLLVLVWLVKALVQLLSFQSIIGVHSFALAVFATDLEFLWPAASAAGGQFEEALTKIELMLSFNSLPEITKDFLQDLRIFVLNKIRLPSLFAKALDHHPPSPESKVYDNWNHCANIHGASLGSKNNKDNVLDKKVQSLPWELDRRLNDFEQKLMNIHSKFEKFFHKKNRHQRNDQVSIIEEELKLLGNELSHYMYALNMVDIPAVYHSRFATLETLRKLVSGKLFFENSKNGAVPAKKEMDLIELNESLLNNWRINTVERFALSREIGSWLEKLEYLDSDQAYKLEMITAKLACKTKNVQVAKHHLLRLEQLQNESQFMEMYPKYQQMNNFMAPMSPFSPAPFNQMAGYPVGPGFVMPVLPPHLQLSPNIPTPFSLELVVQAAKITRLTKNNQDDGTAFFMLGNAISAEDIASCSPSVSPAPGFTKNDPQFLHRVEKVRRAVLRLGSWSNEISNGYQRICETNKYRPSPLWDMIIKRFNILGNLSGDATAEKTLEGSLFWLATEIGGNLVSNHVTFAKAHRKMAQWSIEQLYSNEECIFNLTGTELLSLQTFGISVEHPRYKDFQQALTLSNDFTTFKAEAISILKFVSLSAFESIGFERLWNSIKQRQASLFNISLNGYLHFLSQTSVSDVQRSIHTVTATLNILKMLVTHPELFELTTNGRWLADTNESIWKDIIPQLFARLNHPNEKVRSAISDLLKKISTSSPHAVCFPAIVGAYFSRSILLPGESENSQVAPEMENIDIETNLGLSSNIKQDLSKMTAACIDIVETMEQQCPTLVNDVKKFIQELQRINMLNEEKWYFVLNNLSTEISKRIHQLEAEDERTLASKHLSADEQEAICRKRNELFTNNIAQLLEDLYNLTFKVEVAEPSQNEITFCDEFEDDITRALKNFLEHRSKNPRQAWSPFKKLLSTFSHRASKKSSLSLNIRDLSPFLYSMRNTSIPIPGQELSDNIVTIASMKENVTILVTKTRPKKITFVGSDGKEYIFLFKGQEDLHLDERVMQLLHICNLMLTDKQHIVAEDAWPSYVSRNYSVTPIGIRSGLIRWVSGATSMFQIYRKWKQREAARGDVGNKAGKQEERPMDIFFKHLKSAFQANNIPVNVQQDRKQWPLPVLREALKQLISVTPRDILSKELWMASGNSDTWWRVTQRFSRSTAVASMVGTIIGLGDRHMENLLIDLNTGDVIHIDYNICFDKGRHLRVPETVPFRLTGNIVTALGPTQIEGTFRQSCEHVLTVLRSGKETLLAMLDAFVVNPLVDWTMQDHMASATLNISTILAVYGNNECNLANNQLTLSLFKLRLQEFQSLWMSVAKSLEDILQKALYILQQIKKLNPNNVIDHTSLSDKLGEQTKALHQAIRKHYDLATFFRPLIKNLANFDDMFAIYAREYSENLSESLARGFKLLNENELDAGKCYDALKVAAEHVYEIHNGLVKLGQINELKRTINHISTELDEPHSPNDSKGTVQLRENENAHAKIISRRIRRRLEGREHLQIIDDTFSQADIAKLTRRHTLDAPMCHEGPAMTTAEQVDMLINSATNLNNLCLLYEGWTAWV